MPMVISDLNLDEAEGSCVDSCLETAQACEWCIDECVGEDMADWVRACRMRRISRHYVPDLSLADQRTSQR